MAQTFKTAWSTGKSCWRVLQLDKELMVFPILTFSICALFLGVILFPMWTRGGLAEILEMTGPDADWMSLFILFAVYFVLFFVMIFFNTALIACAKIRFAGGDPTVVDGLRAAIALLPQIFVWSLIGSTVSFILSRIGNGEKGIGRFLVSLLGAGWIIASYFVVPVLVTEKIGTLSALKRSLSIVRNAWGEALVAQVGLAALMGMAGFFIVLVVGTGVLLYETAPMVSVAIWATGAIIVFMWILAVSTLEAIMKAALYVYATDGKVPTQFEAEMIEGAFVHK